MSWEGKWKEFQTADRLDEAPLFKRRRKKPDQESGNELSAEQEAAIDLSHDQMFARKRWKQENADGFEDWEGELVDRGIDPEQDIELNGRMIKLKDAPPSWHANLLTSGLNPPSADWVSRNSYWTEDFGLEAAEAAPEPMYLAGDPSAPEGAKFKPAPEAAQQAATTEPEPTPAAETPAEKEKKTEPAAKTGPRQRPNIRIDPAHSMGPIAMQISKERTAGIEPKSKPASVKTRKKLSKRKQKKFDKMTRQLALTGAQSKVKRMRQKKEKENAEVVAGAGINTMPASRVSRAVNSPSLPSNVSSAVEKLRPRKPSSELPGGGHGYKNTRAAREIAAKKAEKQSQSKRSFEAEQEQTPFKFGSTGIREQRSASFEKKWKNYQRIVESTSKGHLADNEFQQDMKGRRSRNDIYTKPSGHKNTSSGSPFSKRANPKGKSDTYFENINEAEQEVLDSFELQSELNPAAFEGDVMIPEIRERLMEIAQDFLDGIDFKMDVEDITLTGSLANYNWSKYSDFDLHILVDYAAIDADSDLVKRFFQDIKAIWNIRHNIFLKGYEVEVYVQNTNESHMSSGIYSVQNDEWDIKPEQEETARSPIDKSNIEKKADDIIFQIDRAEKLLANGKLDDALDAIDRLKQKVRNLRKIGLSKEDGVYSVENLAFKTLRRSMELERLSTLKNKAYDRQMSITQ